MKWSVQVFFRHAVVNVSTITDVLQKRVTIGCTTLIHYKRKKHVAFCFRTLDFQTKTQKNNLMLVELNLHRFCLLTLDPPWCSNNDEYFMLTVVVSAVSVIFNVSHYICSTFHELS